LIKLKKLLFLIFVFANVVFSQKDYDWLLDKVEKDSFMYFWELYDDKLGLIPDSSREGSPCSIAAVGFGLTAFCIGAERGWVEKNQVYLRIYKTLKTFLYKLEHKNGFFYHFLDMKTGERVWENEISTIDTALFLAGAIVASEYFKGTNIEEMVKKIYDRINWLWALNDKDVLCMGWKPETGFLPYYWDTYSEGIILYALAIGAEKNSIPKECWYKWKRKKCRYGEYEFVACPTGSLFTYQFSHAYIDFKNIVDKYDGTNYFENSKIATLVNKIFCEKRKHKYKTYAEGFWGLSACIGPYGYKGYGSSPGALHDGTVAPSAVGGSVMFLPEVCISTLKLMYERLKDKVYGKYGFVNGFNLDYDWFADEFLGIDTGIILLSIENYRSGFVWRYFMNYPAVKKFVNLLFETKD
jgi:hypothetical protein